MKLHFLQHVPFEDPAYILERARRDRFTVSSTRMYLGEPLPEKHDHDILVIMGGPMGVHDEDEHPWLVREKHFIDGAIGSGKAVLGICLGAQLIATVLGGRVYRNRYREIGWFPLAATRVAPPPIPPTFTAFHWHGDTFDIPAGAVHLACSRACPNQAFMYGKNVLALQFHLEATVNSVSALVDNCRDELDGGPHVQDSDAIIGGLIHTTDTHRIMDGLIDYLLAADDMGEGGKAAGL